MNLVRIGNIVFNLDQVIYIKDTGTGPLMLEVQGGKCIDLVGQADALRAWIASNSTNTTPSGTTVGTITG